MFHIDRAFRAERRQVSAADVCMERSERLSENGFVRRAALAAGMANSTVQSLPQCGEGSVDRGFGVDLPLEVVERLS